MLRCIAIDDEPLALRQLRSYIDRHPTLTSEGYFHDAHEAYPLLEERQIDLILCDIEMPSLNGLEFIGSLSERANGERPIVIFTTAYSEYAIEGFRLEALDYLLKPFSYDDFERSVNRAIILSDLRCGRGAEGETSGELMADGERGGYISVKSSHKTQMIAIDEILYIESEGEYIRIVLQDKSSITTLIRLKNIEVELPSSLFVRTHRCYIVNLNAVRSYDRQRIYIDEKLYIPIGQSHRESVMEALQSRLK